MAQEANRLALVVSDEAEGEIDAEEVESKKSLSRVEEKSPKQLETEGFDTGVDKVSSNVGATDSEADTERDEEGNHVRETVKEFCDLQREMHDLRENLVALGAPFQTVGVMVELGFNGRLDEQEKMIRSCLASFKVNGAVDAAIEARFRQQLLMLTELERDMALARKLAKQSGFVLPALNALTNMIRQNPGDRGHKVVNSFLAYAMAADIKLDRIQEILDKANETEKSVLPVIEIEQPDPVKAARIALVRDLVLGTSLAIAVMWLIV